MADANREATAAPTAKRGRITAGSASAFGPTVKHNGRMVRLVTTAELPHFLHASEAGAHSPLTGLPMGGTGLPIGTLLASLASARASCSLI